MQICQFRNEMMTVNCLWAHVSVCTTIQHVWKPL